MIDETLKMLYRTFLVQTLDRIIERLDDTKRYEEASERHEMNKRLRDICTHEHREAA